MCLQSFTLSEQLKTHMRGEHREELIARAVNYKKDMMMEEQLAEKDKSLAKMKKRLPGGISLNSVQVDQVDQVAKARQVHDLQARHPGLSIASPPSQKSPPVPPITRQIQSQRPSMISKETAPQRPKETQQLRNTIRRMPLTTQMNKWSITRPKVMETQSNRGTSMANVSQTQSIASQIRMPQRIMVTNTLQYKPPSTNKSQMQIDRIPKRIMATSTNTSQYKQPIISTGALRYKQPGTIKSKYNQLQPDNSLHNFFEKIPTTKVQQSNNTLTISSKSNSQSRISVVVNSKPNRIMPSLSNRILPKQTTVGGPRLQISSSSPSSSSSSSSSVALKQSQWPNRVQTRLSARGR